MACTPLDIKKGLFIGQDWTSRPSANFDGKHLTLTKSGLSVDGRNLFTKVLNHSLQYMILADKFLLVLDKETSPGPGERKVFVVDFTEHTWQSVPIVQVVANPGILPVIQSSPENGVVFLAFASDGTELHGVGIYRSDNGQLLCPVKAGSIVADGETTAEAEGDLLVIHYTTNGRSQDHPCTLPLGECEITPATRTFATAFIGGCNPPPTAQFTIKNVGTDCLEIESIAPDAPFSVKSTNPRLPEDLAPDESVLVTIEFNPTTTNNFSSELEVITSPSNGDNAIRCEGESLPAEFKIQFSPSSWPIDFGTLPKGGVGKQEELTIRNNEPGSKKIRVEAEELDDRNFSSKELPSQELDCGESASIQITFHPKEEGELTATLRITSDATSSPHDVGLIGWGCVPNARIEAVSIEPIYFGRIEQGYRTVKFFKVKNTGDGPLTFVGEITEGIELFALPHPDESVIDATSLRKYKAKPVKLCSVEQVEGSGETIVAVSFFANEPPNDDGTPKLVTGSLTLRDHNATNFPADHTWKIPLMAKITPPIPLDIALVVDRSGSMADSLGTRTKMAAAASASHLFVELLRADMLDRVAIVTFDHKPDVVVPMSAVSDVEHPTKEEILVELANALIPGGETAISGGAMTGIKEVQKPRRREETENLKRAVIVLTDGIENYAFNDPPGSDDWYSILGVGLPQPLESALADVKQMPKPTGITIHAIGLGKGDDINEHQLETLGGPCYFHIDRDLSEDKYFLLEERYTQIFMETVEKCVISDPTYWINPLDKHSIEFDVLPGDVDALVVVYNFKDKRLPFYCLSPNEEMIDPSNVPTGFQLRFGSTSYARILEFKMPLNEPERYAGRWQLIVEHPGRTCKGVFPDKPVSPGFLPTKCTENMHPVLYGFAIGVGSNFRMQAFVTPAPVYTGDPILLTALMSEAGLPVFGCEVTAEITLPNGTTLSWPLTLHDDGNHQDGAAKDGEYANTFSQTTQGGTYHFKFRAVGQSRAGEKVVREIVRDKPVLHRATVPPPDLSFQDLTLNVKSVAKAIRKQNDLLKRLLKIEK